MSAGSKFCRECGSSTHGARYCAECGTPTGQQQSLTESAEVPKPSAPSPEATLWRGTPDPLLSPIVARTHRYTITSERVTIEHGLLAKVLESVEVFRIKDVKVRKSVAQRVRGRGDLMILSVDLSAPRIVLESIERPDEICDKLRRLVAETRQRLGITAIERM